MAKIKFVPGFPELKEIAPPPESATRNVPEWYKEQPSMIDDKLEDGTLKLTVKKCQAFFDAMALGYMLKMPVDIYIDATGPTIDVQIPKELEKMRGMILSQHSREQVSHLPIDEDLYMPHILRIHPTWLAQTEPGYSTLFLSPLHSDGYPLKAVEAIIDTDSFTSDGHLSFFVKKGFKGILKQGTPLAQIFPFKREDWEMEIDKDYSPELIQQQRVDVRSTFQNGYKLKHWVKKTFR